jgi:hypothetical protein
LLMGNLLDCGGLAACCWPYIGVLPISVQSDNFDPTFLWS